LEKNCRGLQIKRSKVLTRLSVLFLLTISFGFLVFQSSLGFVLSWVHLNIFSFEMLYLNCFFFSMVYYKAKKYQHAFTLFLFVILVVLLHTLTGSRNGLVIAVVLFFSVFLSLFNSYKISIKSILTLVCIFSFVFLNFFLSQAIRESLGDKDRLNLLKIQNVQPSLLVDRHG